MKLCLTSLLLASAATFATIEARPSTLQARDDAIAARERLLLRPAWRPATSTTPTAPGPLRRGRRAEESKIAFRHNSGRRQSQLNAAAAVPIHINYADGAVNMPFPLAMQIKRDASQQEQDPDMDEDFDCEEEEDPHDGGRDVPPQEQTSAASWTANAEPTSSVTSDGRTNPKIKAEETAPSVDASSSWQSSSSSDNSASPVGSFVAPSDSSASSSDGTTIRNATGEAPASDPSSLAAGSTTVAQGCTRFHTVVAGEVCLGILDGSRDIGLTLDQLYAYNPIINAHCTDLQVGQTLCTGKA